MFVAWRAKWGPHRPLVMPLQELTLDLPVAHCQWGREAAPRGQVRQPPQLVPGDAPLCLPRTPSSRAFPSPFHEQRCIAAGWLTLADVRSALGSPQEPWMPAVGTSVAAATAATAGLRVVTHCCCGTPIGQSLLG